MKVKNAFPPNYDAIVAYLGDVSFARPIFCYGDTIYNPFDRVIGPDDEQHEFVHSKQQQGYSSPEAWYNLYLSDRDFRLQQELEAYGEQFVFAKNQGIRGAMLSWLNKKLAFELSGEAYGKLISFGEASSKIRNYGQSN